MLLPLSWLKEFVDLEGITPDILEEKLFESGFEVEEKKYLGEEISNCVVGLITSITKHPDSDHLQICILDCGEKYGHEIQIVTGAQNVFVGAKVPAALHGATLANGVKIKNGKLRGIDSNGMLCSGGELGITEEFFTNAGVDGILILPADTEIGKDIKEVVGLDDWVFDISITANRPDCESILGMAREVAVIFKRLVRMPELNYTAQPTNHELTVEVEDKINCPKYLGNVVDEIKIETSPVWLRQRLVKTGINPKNNIVDITNYILKELGQPMHAFDYTKLDNHKIVVRSARQFETIKTLDEKENELSTTNLVIADANKPVALAGIMGGFDSGVQDNTKTIVFESAKFLRESVRKTSRALGIASDSSHRYEKGVDEYTTTLAMQRALNLIEFLNAGKVSSTCASVVANPPVQQIIESSFGAINKILGIDVPQDEVVDILTRLGFGLDVKNDGTFTATVPLFRGDLDGTPDLAEEVIRIYGFKHITPRLLTNTQITKGGLNDEQKLVERVKNTLAGMGLNEIVTYSFCGERHLDMLNLPPDAPERNFIKIANPLTADIAIMKTTLVAGMLEVITTNFKRGVESGKLFELANVYIPKEIPLVNLPHERKTLCLGAWGENESFFTMKGYIETLCSDVFGVKLSVQPTQKSFLHPNISGIIMANDVAVGYLGKVTYEITEELSITPNTFVAELDYEKLSTLFVTDYHYTNISKFPSIKRDLAFVVKNEITSGQIEALIKQTAKRVSEVKLFDVYTGEKLGEGLKSMAYNLVFDSTDTAITHEEVDAQIKKILNRLQFELGITLRS